MITVSESECRKPVSREGHTLKPELIKLVGQARQLGTVLVMICCLFTLVAVKVKHIVMYFVGLGI